MYLAGCLWHSSRRFSKEISNNCVARSCKSHVSVLAFLRGWCSRIIIEGWAFAWRCSVRRKLSVADLRQRKATECTCTVELSAGANGCSRQCLRIFAAGRLIKYRVNKHHSFCFDSFITGIFLLHIFVVRAVDTTPYYHRSIKWHLDRRYMLF